MIYLGLFISTSQHITLLTSDGVRKFVKNKKQPVQSSPVHQLIITQLISKKHLNNTVLVKKQKISIKLFLIMGEWRYLVITLSFKTKRHFTPVRSVDNDAGFNMIWWRRWWCCIVFRYADTRNCYTANCLVWISWQRRGEEGPPSESEIVSPENSK